MKVEITFLIGRIAAILVFLFTTPLIGFAKAWVADKLGDPTPRALGFLTLSLQRHISTVWYRQVNTVPIDFNAYSPTIIRWPRLIVIPGSARIKMLLAYFADTFAAAAIAALSLAVLVAVLHIAPLVLLMTPVTVLFSDCSSLTMVVVTVFQISLIFNVRRAAFSFLLNCALLIARMMWGDDVEYASPFASLLIAVILVMLLEGPLKLHLIHWIVTFVSHLTAVS